jgi:hypothetical protein
MIGTRMGLGVGLALGLAGSVSAQVLFDGGLGTPPSGQAWTFIALPSLASETFAEGAARLDTTVSGSIFAGWSRQAPVPLDRSTGFSVQMEFLLESESHASTNRAGLSMIVLGQDRKGLEIGIWTNRVWVQADSPMFTQGEGAELGISGGWRTLRLSVAGDSYRLSLDGAEVLGGVVRDYTPFVGTIDPYETPNFLFIGDDTTSARGAYRLRKVELIVGGGVPPALRVVGLADGQAELAWSAADGLHRWKLETTSALVGGTWTTSATERSTAGDDVRVRVPVMGESAWFRLR